MQESVEVREDRMTEEQLAHERKVRERILEVVHDLRHEGNAITTESIVQKDREQREEFEQRRWWHNGWDKPDLSVESAAIAEIIPTLIDLTGCLTADPRIRGWLSLEDFQLKGGAHCSFAGVDAGRAVWWFRKCGKPAAYIATEGVITFSGRTPRERDTITWIGVCEEHLPHADGMHLAAFHRDDHKRDGGTDSGR